MNKIINDIEVESMQFINKKNDIVLLLVKHKGADIVYKKKLLFENILAMEMLSDEGQESFSMPYTFLEINIQQVNLSEESQLPKFAQSRRGWKSYINAYIVLASGDIELNLICEKVIETDN